MEKKKTNNFTCIVCGDTFTDGWKHVLAGKGIMFPKDSVHADYIERVQQSGYTLPCFCGGSIGSWGTKYSYSYECNDCGFLWDED